MDKLLQMIGMAKRAGKLVSGGFLSEKAIKSGESRLIVLSRDISDESRKSITDSCKYYNVKYIEYADRGEYCYRDGHCRHLSHSSRHKENDDNDDGYDGNEQFAQEIDH